MTVVLEIALILLLVLTNGLFALAEMSVVSARRARLERLARDGRRGARTALELAASPDRFLATVQIGITLVGILAGVVSGATLVGHLSERLADVPAVAPYAEALALTIVVAAITYFSLVLGELLPKRLALNHPERIATAIARPMRRLSLLASPVVHALTASTAAALKVLRVPPPESRAVTEDEIRLMIEIGASSGVFEDAERGLAEGVFQLDDLRIGAVMTPRRDVRWIDADAPRDVMYRAIAREPHSRYLVCRGSLEHILGVLLLKDVLPQLLAGKPVDVIAALRQPAVIPERASALDALEALKGSLVHLAVVVNEFGTLEGIVTITDLVEVIVRDLPDAERDQTDSIVEREDGSWLLDGRLAIHKFKLLLGVDALPDESRFHTLAGFVLSQFERIPSVGDHFTWGNLRVEVVDMDRQRVDRVLVSKVDRPDEVDAPCAPREERKSAAG